jgi:diguanylate cyclase
VRAGDIVGRLGGDEFLIVCRGTPTADVALAAARRVARAGEDPLALRVGPITVRLSVGVAHSSGDSATADELINAADEAMYCAKRGLCASPNLAANTGPPPI